MKKLTLSHAFLLIAIISFAQKDEDKSMQKRRLGPDAYVISSIHDAKLKKNEALYVFHFAPIKNKTIKITYNGQETSERQDTNGTISLKVKPGKYQFVFFYTNMYHTVIFDSSLIAPQAHTEVQINMTPYKMNCAKKPVIYVYTEKPTEVNIALNVNGGLGFTYPAYNSGWKFVADPDGTIHMNDKSYNYLFWDGSIHVPDNTIDWKQGFVVNKSKLTGFFEDKLTQMGLAPNEIDEFITYWCPLMNANENNYIHFIYNSDYDKYAALNVSPAPDKQFRVFMFWSKTDANEKAFIKDQPIQSFSRKGLTLVEWGGAEMTGSQKKELSAGRNVL